MFNTLIFALNVISRLHPSRDGRNFAARHVGSATIEPGAAWVKRSRHAWKRPQRTAAARMYAIQLQTLKGQRTMKQIINGKSYDTKTAQVVASDRYWDGHNWERNGRNMYLYKTTRGAFFILSTSQWQGERDTLEALTEDEAKALYESLHEQEMTYAEAFGVEPEEA